MIEFNLTDGQGMALIVTVAFFAGFIRGFTGFGGPSFMLAILTWFYTPLFIIAKILVIELIAGTWLFATTHRNIQWRKTLALSTATMATMPLGIWVLMHTDPEMMRRSISAVIFFVCLLMASGFRYRRELPLVALIALGLIGGFVFGAAYVALVVVAVVLLGPSDKTQARTLLIAWGFFVSVWYCVISLLSGVTDQSGIIDALPAAGGYISGAMLGSTLFKRSGEAAYRTVALYTLMFLSLMSFLG